MTKTAVVDIRTKTFNWLENNYPETWKGSTPYAPMSELELIAALAESDDEEGRRRAKTIVSYAHNLKQSKTQNNQAILYLHGRWPTDVLGEQLIEEPDTGPEVAAEPEDATVSDADEPGGPDNTPTSDDAAKDEIAPTKRQYSQDELKDAIVASLEDDGPISERSKSGSVLQERVRERCPGVNRNSVSKAFRTLLDDGIVAQKKPTPEARLVDAIWLVSDGPAPSTDTAPDTTDEATQSSETGSGLPAEPHVVRSTNQQLIVRAMEELGFDVYGTVEQGAKDIITAAVSKTVPMSADSVNSVLNVLRRYGVVKRNKTTSKAATHVALIKGSYIFPEDVPDVAPDSNAPVRDLRPEETREITISLLRAEGRIEGGRRLSPDSATNIVFDKVVAICKKRHIEAPEKASVQTLLWRLENNDAVIQRGEENGSTFVEWVGDSNLPPASEAEQEAPGVAEKQETVPQNGKMPARSATREAVKSVLRNGVIEGGVYGTPHSANATVTRLALAKLPGDTNRGAVTQMLNHLDKTDIIRRWEEGERTFVEWVGDSDDVQSPETTEDAVSADEKQVTASGHIDTILGSYTGGVDSVIAQLEHFAARRQQLRDGMSEIIDEQTALNDEAAAFIASIEGPTRQLIEAIENSA